MRNKDEQILRLVRDFRLVTEPQLRELTGRQTLWRRLPVLVAQKKLHRRRRGVFEPYVYADYNISKRSEFAHDLMITDVHIALHKSGRLVEWTQSVQKLKGELNEDAFCVVSSGTKTLHCFIEADNSSEPDWQIREKVLRYLTDHRTSHRIFRVLFVAPDEKRRSELVRVSERAIPREVSRMFLFTSLPDFKQDCFAPICDVCDNHPISLAPAVAASA